MHMHCPGPRPPGRPTRHVYGCFRGAGRRDENENGLDPNGLLVMVVLETGAGRAALMTRLHSAR